MVRLKLIQHKNQKNSFRMRQYLKLILFSACCFSACTSAKKASNISQTGSASGGSNTVWTTDRANNWYTQQAWLVGGNYTPAYSINQLEFWQQETFDTARINTS
jgi:hypothetical protein